MERSVLYHGYWLVQRLQLSPAARYAHLPKDSPMAKATGTHYNPFGYGRMGDYEADYMGSAEFEFGALGQAYKRFSDAPDVERVVLPVTFKKQTHDIEFVYPQSTEHTEQDQRFDEKEFQAWVKDNCPNKDDWSFRRRLEGEDDEYIMRTGIWWALQPDVMWAFADDRTPEGEAHFDRLFGSMAAGEKIVLR